MADDVRPALAGAARGNAPSALVTLYAVEGGGPRPPGTQMVFTRDEVCGFLSGGCVEGDVALHAAATLEDGVPRHLVYGEGGPWPDIRLLCGARIELLVERVLPGEPAVKGLLDLMERRRPAIWRTDGVRRRCEEGLGPRCQVIHNPFELTRCHLPTPRLIVVGGDPTALAIASLGSQSGMETTLVRPKGPEQPPPIPSIAYRRDSAGEAIANLAPDAWTAVAIATHDLDADHDALMAVLPSGAGYVGLLGARRRLAGRLDALRGAGMSEKDLGRLHAPIGIPTGGKAPWEVATSVIAEIMAERPGAA